MDKLKGLFIGDGIAPTGFSTVMDNILGNLSTDTYDIHHLAINYWGDPHDRKYKVYPAGAPTSDGRSNLMGYARLPQMLTEHQFDFIFILNDVWVLNNYLEVIKEFYQKNPNKKLPKVVVYFPVDGGGYTQGWFKNFDIVTKAVVYTEFGKTVVNEAMPRLKLEIIPHGSADKSSFFQIDPLEAKKAQFGAVSWLQNEDTFIVMNANRNQPRKRIDLALWGFALFAKNKGQDVAYYHHAGTQDAGWELSSLVTNLTEKLKFDLGSRVFLTNNTRLEQRVSKAELNLIYNACDVGLNTSLGEGWGLTGTEHGYLGKPQVVPNHTACAELFGDIGVTIPVNQVVLDPVTMLERYFVDAEDVASKLEYLYQNRDEMKLIGERTREKFSQPYYDWTEIAKKWDTLFRSL